MSTDTKRSLFYLLGACSLGVGVVISLKPMRGRLTAFIFAVVVVLWVMWLAYKIYPDEKND